MLILRKYPFHMYPVNLWSIESNKLDRKELVSFMDEKGYRCSHYDKTNTFCQLLSEEERTHDHAMVPESETKNIMLIAKKPSYHSGEGGMTDAVIDIMNHKRSGIFVEMGAND